MISRDNCSLNPVPLKQNLRDTLVVTPAIDDNPSGTSMSANDLLIEELGNISSCVLLQCTPLCPSAQIIPGKDNIFIPVRCFWHEYNVNSNLFQDNDAPSRM